TSSPSSAPSAPNSASCTWPAARSCARRTTPTCRRTASTSGRALRRADTHPETYNVHHRGRARPARRREQPEILVMSQEVVIVDAARTAIGTFGGTLAGMPAHELGAVVIRALLGRTGVAAESVDEVILGQVLTAGVGQNPARQAAMAAGLPKEVPAMTINKVCGSGLKAVSLAAQAIRCGDADIVIAGGQENMSIAPHVLPKSRNGQKMGDWKMIDSMIVDGLWDAFNDYHMGNTAENVAKKYGLDRAAQDEFAAASQAKTAAAQEAGRFDDEIVPVSIPQRKGDPVVFAKDEFPRAGTTAEVLAKRRPAFTKDGSVTAGNASGINDGAAAVLVMSAA